MKYTFKIIICIQFGQNRGMVEISEADEIQWRRYSTIVGNVIYDCVHLYNLRTMFKWGGKKNVM